MSEEVTREEYSEVVYKNYMLAEFRKLNKSIASIAKSLERIANPPIKLDRHDPNTIEKATRDISRMAGFKKKKSRGQVGQ